ncbi:hypothetical protein, partial [Kribbella sp. NPDC048915]|uniref:hypothetical protein n=1 Tax=Kribbella sp. NPDC048915 TaxID=3155148 RepID=UPI0033F2F3E0
ASTHIDLIGRIGTTILDAVLPTRRPRTHTRAIKRAISKHRAKTPHTDRRTHPTTTHITINPLPTTPDG